MTQAQLSGAQPTRRLFSGQHLTLHSLLGVHAC